MTDSSKALAHYEKLVAKYPDLQIKGKASSYTSMNGNMFSFLTDQGGLALRLPEKEREAFLKKYKTKLVEAHGTVMKEYAHVPARLLARRAEIAKHFAISVDYVASLKPKATTRKKAAKKATKKATTRKKVATKKKATRKKAAVRKKSTRRS